MRYDLVNVEDIKKDFGESWEWFMEADVDFNVVRSQGRVECWLSFGNDMEFRGVARKNPNDQWVELIGKDLAYRRAMQKVRKYVINKEIKLLEKEYKKILDKLINVKKELEKQEKMLSVASKPIEPLELRVNDRLPF